MSKKFMAQRTPLSCALMTATAMIGMAFSMQVSAYTAIPLTLEDAKAVATSDEQSSISAGAQYTHINGSGPTAAKAWNGYESAKAAADVDVNLKGGEGLNSWSVQGTDLGTPIPEVTGEYGVAGKWDVDGRFKRFRHVSADIGLADPAYLNTNIIAAKTDLSPYFHETVLEQVRDVYAVNGRLFVLPQLTVTAGYQLDHRSGDLSLSNRDGGNPVEQKYGLDDNHHQVKTAAEYIGNNWTLSADYYMSKFDNSNDEFLDTIKKSIKVNNVQVPITNYTARSLDPSNTLHRIGVNATYQPTAGTTLGMRAAYTWNELDSTVYSVGSNAQSEAAALKATGLDTDIRMPEFAIGLTSHPLDALSVKLDYSFRKVDQNVTGGTEDWYDGSYKEHKVAGSGIYNLGQGYSVKLHGKYKQKDYFGDNPEEKTYTTVDTVKTYTTGIELRKRMSDILSGSVGYTYQGRNTSGWHLGTDEGEPTTTYEWNWADYDQHSFDLHLVSSPVDSVTLSFLGSIYKRNYKNLEPTPFDGMSYENGMTDAKGFLFGLDVDWAPSRDWNAFAFYNYDRMTSDAHADWIYIPHGTTTHIPTKWDSDSKSQSHTLGLGFGVHPVNQPWKATFRYVFGYDTDQYTLGKEVKNHVRSHFVTADLDYKINARWTLMGATAYGHGGSYDLHRSGNDYYAGDTGVDIINSPNYNFFGVFIGAKYLLP